MCLYPLTSDTKHRHCLLFCRLITNRIYNPAYLNLVINDFLVDKLAAGYLSPQVQVQIPSSGAVTLQQTQLTSLSQQTLQPLGLR